MAKESSHCLTMLQLKALLWLGCLLPLVGAFVPAEVRSRGRSTVQRWTATSENEQMLPELDEENLPMPEINGYSMPLGQKQNGYSAFLDREKPASWLSRWRAKPAANNYDYEMDEDGYAGLQRSRSKLKQMARLPLNFARKVMRPSTKEPGLLILVRHGESEWNRNKTFTGWADPDLTEQGKREVEHAARLLMEGGYKIDVVFTSRLKRAIRSVWILLQEFNEVYLPVFKSWRLNERMVST